MQMKLIGAALLAVGTVAATAGTAEARDGCGLGFHRNFYGCLPPQRLLSADRRASGLRLWLAPSLGLAPPRVAYGGWHRHWGWHHGWRRW